MNMMFGLNIFYFKLNWTANKHKAYEWLSTVPRRKQYITKTCTRIHSHLIDIHYKHIHQDVYDEHLEHDIY